MYAILGTWHGPNYDSNNSDPLVSLIKIDRTVKKNFHKNQDRAA